MLVDIHILFGTTFSGSKLYSKCTYSFSTDYNPISMKCGMCIKYYIVLNFLIKKISIKFRFQNFIRLR